MIKSKEIKTALLAYLRYKRQMIAATEVSYTYGISDVVAIDKDGTALEVEIKCTMSDLKREIEPGYKLKKHQGKGPTRSHDLPNKFYFCVPSTLYDNAAAWIEKELPSSGIMIYLEGRGHFEDRIRVAKSAKKLRDTIPRRAKDQVIKRLCSEVIGCYIRECKREAANEKE